MKFQRIYALVLKDIKKLVRQPASLFLVILFPLILTGAFGLAFGSLGGTGTDINYTIGVVDLDESNWSQFFIGNLSESEVLNSKDYIGSSFAQSDLEQGKIDAYIIIPNNFGESLYSYWNNLNNSNNWVNTSIDLFVDQGSQVVSFAIPPLISQILAVTIYGEEAMVVSRPVSIGNPSLVETEHLTQFDLMAPGMFVFAVIFLTMIVAEGFTIERTEGLLARMQVTPTSASDIMISSIIAYMATALIQVGIVFGVAGFMGFNPQNDLSGIVFAFVIVSLLALMNVGFGLITATLAKTPGSATGISFIFILPQMFFGTFIPNMPQEIAQFVPSYYVTDALTSVLLRGASIMSSTVLYDLSITILLSVVVIVVGIGVFAKFGKD